ncbi:hypothetical protein FSP39_019404 [Pinctada imbricata]|uniref:GST N-terminal domain-containing protein n=1 Tax=Pinctada imbricata TaxID=66713 RepID=A0AA89C871_PINIB|nr:hypothetical protein FSP39_019404 [Pinctada imbricata]
MQQRVDDKKQPCKYKLTYFNLRGRGELPRLILAAAGVPFEDKRIQFGKEWEEFKPNYIDYSKTKSYLPQGKALSIDGSFRRIFHSLHGTYMEIIPWIYAEYWLHVNPHPSMLLRNPFHTDAESSAYGITCKA